jgi:glycosyltransferase involved in cell wall biosynthesis
VRIFGWAANDSGTGQYRMWMPMWALHRAGHDVRISSSSEAELPTEVDVVVGQVIVEEDRTAAWQRLAVSPGRPAMVFEIDDDIWNIHGSNDLGLAFRERALQERAEANIAVSDAVTVTTEHLAEIVGRFNSNVHVVPNQIDASLLQRQRPRHERLTIGWAGGSSHQNDFASVQAELRTFLRRNEDVDLHVIGHDYRQELGRPLARHTGWTADLRQYLDSVDFDIGVAPIAYHAFNKAKSDLKVLEYAALGIPVVATDFGPYPASVQHGETGFLVRHSYVWVRYLRDLVNDDAMREQMGRNARRWAAGRTVQGNVWRWEAAYRSATGCVLAPPRGEIRRPLQRLGQGTQPW